MQLSEAIQNRRSIRKFKTGIKIPREHIEKMLEAAMMAPSAVNSRPLEFAVAESEELKESLMRVHPSCPMLKTASAAIVVIGRPDLQPGRSFWPQDCGAAIENLLLQALDLGYGTCWCGCYPVADRAEGVKKVIGTEGVPVAIVAVGVPDEAPAARGFYDPSRVKFL